MHTTLKRKRQSGSVTEEEQRKIGQDINTAEEELATCREHASKARGYYNEMTARCKEQWVKIEQLSRAESTPSINSELNVLKHSFTWTLSADYQMSKLVPHWGSSPQPGSTYYLQKLSNDLFEIVHHNDEKAHIFLMRKWDQKILTTLFHTSCITSRNLYHHGYDVSTYF